MGESKLVCMYVRGLLPLMGCAVGFSLGVSYQHLPSFFRLVSVCGEDTSSLLPQTCCLGLDYQVGERWRVRYSGCRLGLLLTPCLCGSVSSEKNFALTARPGGPTGLNAPHPWLLLDRLEPQARPWCIQG